VAAPTVCTENSKPGIVVMKSAEDGKRFDATGPVYTENLNPNVMVMKPAQEGA
jgi:hypothetical protein